MKTKLLHRLRRRAMLDIGIVARVFRWNELEYSVGSRLEIWKGNFHNLDHSYSRYGAIKHLQYLRRKHILSLLKDLREAKARKEVKKLNRKLRML